MDANEFPRCPLYDVRLVRSLPADCPLRAPNELVELRRRIDAAWMVIGDPMKDHAAAHADLRAAEICCACPVRFHAVGRGLQAEATRARESAERETAATDTSCKPSHDRPTTKRTLVGGARR